MRAPAPYCPETIARIRTESASRSTLEIAASLNWGCERLLRVAAHHSIHLARPSATLEGAPRPAIVREPEPPPAERKRAARLNAGMTFDEILDQLTPNQRELLRALKSSLGSGKYMQARDLSTREPDAVRCGIHDLRNHLRPTKYAIQSARGHNGGYRLEVLP